MDSINVIIIYIFNSDTKWVPLEDWINPSLHLNSSTWNSQKPSPSILLCSLYICGAASGPPPTCPPFHPTHCPSHSIFTVPRAQAFNWFPREIKFKHFVVFWVPNWRLSWDAKGPNMRHRAYHHLCVTLFSLSVPSVVLRRSQETLTSTHTQGPSCSEHLPQETFQNISYPWIGVSRWNELWRLQCSLPPYLHPWKLGGGLGHRESTTQDGLWHLRFQLTLTPLHSSQGLQQGLLWIAPCSVDKQRSLALSSSDTPHYFFRQGLFCVSQGPR